MKTIIVELIRKFGLKILLRELAAVLGGSKDRNEQILGQDIAAALHSYERRCGDKQVGS